MSNGVLGKGMSSQGTYVGMYTVPAGVAFATINVNICNGGTVDAAVRIAISTSAAPANADHIERGAIIAANGGVLERTCLVLSAGEKVFVFADSNDCAVRVYGLEQASA